MSSGPRFPDGSMGSGDGSPKALRLVAPPAVSPREPLLFPFSRSALLAGLLLSMGICLASLVWTSGWKPAEVVIADQVPVIVAEPVAGERPAPEDPAVPVPERVVELPPPPPRQSVVVIAPPVEDAALPTTDAKPFDGKPIESDPAWEELAMQFIKVEPKKPKPVTRKPSPPRKSSRVAMKIAPVRKAATLLRRIQPVYPLQARRAGVEGSVLLTVAVRSDGRVGSVVLANSSGSGLLDSAAMRAVRKWSFRPATLNGKAVNSELRVPVRFQLRNSG